MKPTKSFLGLRETLLQQGREEVFKEAREEAIKQGMEEGRVQIMREYIEHFLIHRFGAIDESLASSIEPLLKWSIADLARLMLELSSLTRDEFLARCQALQNRNGTH